MVLLVNWLRDVPALIAELNKQVGGDYIIFYATSKLTLAGRALEAFNAGTLHGVEHAVVPQTPSGLYWCYPPTFKMLIAPLALLPFYWSYVVFETLTFIPLLLLVTRIAGFNRWVVILTLGFPGVFGNFLDGQNGFLTAAILGWGLVLVERRGFLGGAILGLLVYKPQFGVLLPVLLLGAGHWRAVFGAAASGLLMIATATALFGVQDWILFLRALPAVSHALEAGELPWVKIPSVLVGLRSVGISIPQAQLIQGAVSLIAAGVTLLCWRRPAPHALKVGLAVFAAFLVSPYSFNYDLVLLAIPLAAVGVMVRESRAPLPQEVALLIILTALLPTLSIALGSLSRVQPSALLMIVCFAIMARITWREGAGAGAQKPVEPPMALGLGRLQPL